MSRAVISLATVTTLLLLAASVLGLLAPGSEQIRLYHFLLGLFAALLTTFVHCMVMFYFIGTSKVIREAAADLQATARDYTRETRRLAGIVHPQATLALTGISVATILGGAARSEALPAWVHLLAAIAAIALNGLAFRLEHRAARTNSQLIE